MNIFIELSIPTILDNLTYGSKNFFLSLKFFYSINCSIHAIINISHSWLFVRIVPNRLKPSISVCFLGYPILIKFCRSLQYYSLNYFPSVRSQFKENFPRQFTIFQEKERLITKLPLSNANKSKNKNTKYSFQ